MKTKEKTEIKCDIRTNDCWPSWVFQEPRFVDLEQTTLMKFLKLKNLIYCSLFRENIVWRIISLP